MPERPLLILPAPGEPEKRSKKRGGPESLQFPSRERQTGRLTPRLEALREAFEARTARLRIEAAGLAPEDVIVLEIIGTIEDFVVGIRNINGLEWLGEIEEEEIPPDDDFFYSDKEGVPRPDKLIPRRAFLVFTNRRALSQILSLWETWKAGNPIHYGLKKWAQLFEKLHDIRPWGVQDRLEETGILEDWRERGEHGEEIIPCEIELWYRTNPEHRKKARDRVVTLVKELSGNLVAEATIEEIAYHTVLVELPVNAINEFVRGSGLDASLVQCEQIQFFRAAGQMTVVFEEGLQEVDPNVPAEPPTDLDEPIVALFDGLPLQHHVRLAGRLVLDDPDNYEAQYPAKERRHGTAMASLILHGDLEAGEPPLNRKLYVRPILKPDPRAWFEPKPETFSERNLVVDLLHRAIRRLFVGEGNEGPVAPHVCVVNLSVGIKDRLFYGPLSPLARLLDWLAWKYRLLFLVSAGNHVHAIELPIPRAELSNLTPRELQSYVIRALAGDSRHRRLLSPGEAVNVLTIGSIHHDSSTATPPADTIQPFVDGPLPSPFNAQGMGYKRAIKPDILIEGGRIVLRESLNTTTHCSLELFKQPIPPGQRVAAPGPSPGDLIYTEHQRGTSNATAIASRSAAQLYNVVEELATEPGGDLINTVPRSIWLKTLLAHSATWGQAWSILERILRNQQNTRKFKEFVTRLLGYGTIEPSRMHECTELRVTALSGGSLESEKAHLHRFPLPPSLAGLVGWKRLAITLGWLSPVNPLHQGWRRAALWFKPPDRPLLLKRKEADRHAVQRGTLQHEVLEGEQATAFVDGDNLEILVNCRPDAGAIDEPIPYALAVTLEVAPEMGIEIYEEVRTRVLARVAITQ